MLFVIQKAAPDPILAVADRMAPRLRKAFLDAVAAAMKRVSLADLQKAIQRGDTAGLITMLDGTFTAALQGAGLPAGVASLRDAIQQVFAAAAQAATIQLPPAIGVRMSFDLLNPHAVDWLRSYNFDLIQRISVDTRQAIQQRILRAFQEGGHPYEQARTIRQVIGLTPKQELAVTNYRRAIEEGRLESALNRALRDGRYDRTVLSAIRQGKGLDQARIDQMVERYRQRYLKYRAENIARTETIRAGNKGRRESWQQARQQGLLPDSVKRKWIAVAGERTCKVCHGLNGQLAGLDEEFAPGILDPPDPHPSCRCTTGLVFQARAKAA